MDKKNLIIKLFKSLRGEKELVFLRNFNNKTIIYFEGTLNWRQNIWHLDPGRSKYLKYYFLFLTYNKDNYLNKYQIKWNVKINNLKGNFYFKAKYIFAIFLIEKVGKSFKTVFWGLG